MLDNSMIHTDDLIGIQTDILMDLSQEELEDYIRESRCTIDNAQMVLDRLRAVRMEKIRRECISSEDVGEF